MKLYRQFFTALTMITASFLISCGGGGSSSSSLNSPSSSSGGSSSNTSNAEFGTVQIILTDAEEDFLTYRVQVNSISLINLAGTEVDVLSIPTEVDFVQYQELSELFAVRSIPVGTYESINLELDYTDAEIVIQDELGNPATASVVDSDGNPIETLSVEMHFGSAQAVRISPSRIANLTLDLDLAASNEITSFNPAEVVVEPFLMATVELDRTREHRVRGLLKSVDIVEENFILDLIPMRHRNGSFGEVSLNTDFETLYDIDGIEYQGSLGLEALSGLAVDAPVIAFGGYDSDQDGPLLSRVVAGSSIPWTERDLVKGTVTARSGNTLTVAGAVIETSSGPAYFGRNIMVTVSDDTVVTGYRLGDADIQNLSIGQTIIALGEFTDDGTDFGGTLDAESGQVRMKISNVIGRVDTLQPLTLQVRGINRRPIDIFDFTGTGASPAFDTDPNNYEVFTGSLDLSNLNLEERIIARGYPTAFGMAPEDFEAVSIIDPGFNDSPAGLITLWEKDAAETLTIDGIDIYFNLDQARMAIRVAGLDNDGPSYELNHLDGEVEGRYAIQVRGEGIRIYNNYTDFITSLSSLLNMGDEARKITARGEYDLDTEVMTAKVILVTF